MSWAAFRTSLTPVVLTPNSSDNLIRWESPALVFRYGLVGMQALRRFRQFLVLLIRAPLLCRFPTGTID
jgi:hypothetical protein